MIFQKSVDWLEISRISAEDARVEAAAQKLSAIGVADLRRVAPSFSQLLSLPIFSIAAERIATHLLRAASPGRAMLSFQEAVERLESQRGDASALFVEPVLAISLELAGASARGARMLATDPVMAIELGARVKRAYPDERIPFADACGRIAQTAGEDTARFDRLLRRYRNRQMMRIALRELRGADVRSTALELADLASAAMQASIDHHLPLVKAQLGAPDPACEHAVIGMGKLGGRELNFSSDIDVIYLYEHDEGGAGEVSQHQFHVKLFERVTASLSKITEHGFVFRVDLDLRPEGKRGPLANSLVSAERYYETWGRTWERAAWIKARTIAGSAALGEKIGLIIRPFVYRRSMDHKAIDEIVEMKKKIDVARRRAGLKKINAGLDLKLGSGGIREIEFFVQVHQLLHGGRDARLRDVNTLEALQSLEAAGLVSAKTREVLSDAYLLFRKVEHRLQIAEEQQTHTVPESEEIRAGLARSLGYETQAGLISALNEHMSAVHETFLGLLGDPSENDSPQVELVMDLEAEESERLEALVSVGSSQPYASLANYSTAARFYGSPFHPRAGEGMRRLGGRFLAECFASPDVDRALRHLPDLTKTLALHRSYLEQLAQPAIARGVARVLGASDLLARILVSSPARLFDVLSTGKPTPSKALASLIKERFSDEHNTEAVLAALRGIKQKELLRCAMTDLAGAINIEAVGLRLSLLAEALIEAALALALDEMSERYGAPEDPSARLAVIAGGTLGARELGYRTDVDLSVIYEGEGETCGAKRSPISCKEFFTRVVQRLLSFLSMRMPQGDLYPVDMRLRPSGNQGALVTSLKNFARYHERGAQLWERQALVRSRTIAGDDALCAEVDAALSRAVYEAGPVDGASDKIHQMRLRMEQARSVKSVSRVADARLIDLKFGSGGLVEVEFLVQYLLIQHGGARPELRTTSTQAALGALGEAGLLSMERASRLKESYGRLRQLLNWLRIAHDENLDHLDLQPERLRPLALAVGYEGREASSLLIQDLTRDMESNHLVYQEVLGGPAVC